MFWTAFCSVKMCKKSDADMYIHLHENVFSDLESVCDTHTHHMHHTTQHNIGKERETRLFFDSTGGGAGPFSLICLVNSVNERDLSLLKSSGSDLYLIATYMYMYMKMYKFMFMYLVSVTYEHQHQDPHIAPKH